MNTEIENKQEERCPQCGNHCPADALKCGRGRRYFETIQENVSGEARLKDSEKRNNYEGKDHAHGDHGDGKHGHGRHGHGNHGHEGHGHEGHGHEDRNL